MSHRFQNRNGQQRGAAIIGVLFFILISSVLLMGMGTFAVSHQTRVKADANYAAALDLADAGVSYEYRKLSLSTSNPDQLPGGTYTLGTGTFTVYCSNKDGTTPWTPGNFLFVTSTGTVNGVSRTVRVASKAYYDLGRFAIYTMGGSSDFKGSAMNINGDIGTNAQVSFNAAPTLSGSVYLYGSGASLNGSHTTGYSKATYPNALQWPTVEQLASGTVTGGLATLAVANDNWKASPPIVGNSITDDVTLTTGNYYVTNINLTGTRKITFDNSSGSVNIWVGPAGGTSTCKFRGGTAAIPISSDPTKACHIYVATTTGIDMAGNQQVDALVYAYNKHSNGLAYGTVEMSGNPVINGQVFGNTVNINGNPTINYTTNLVTPVGGGYYGYDDSWQELNGR